MAPRKIARVTPGPQAPPARMFSDPTVEGGVASFTCLPESFAPLTPQSNADEAAYRLAATTDKVLIFEL